MNVGRGGFGASGKSESGGSKDDDFTDDEGDETDSGGSAGDKKKIHVFQKKASTKPSTASDLTQVCTGLPLRHTPFGKAKTVAESSHFHIKVDHLKVINLSLHV